MKRILYCFCVLACSLNMVSCNEDSFLEEVPMDFLSLENAYVSYSDYESALTGLYNMVRGYEYSESGLWCMLGTDVAYNARRNTDRLGNLVTHYVPTSSMVKTIWENQYKLIKNANTINTRVQESSLTDQQKTRISAEARFFRAFAYRTLVYYYGGVPINREEIIAPKNDFERASKQEVLEFMKEDFEYAASNLAGIADVIDGKVSDLVAKHYLAETLISLGDYSSAVKYASEVIDNSNTALMTKRFGSRVSAVPNGDVYFDLFQRKNQNRKTAGNTEALWVIQMEEDVIGGYTVTTGTYVYPDLN